MPIDRSAIDAQLRDAGEGERWWEQREFRELPYILHADERILGLVTGWLLGPRRPRLLPRATWLIVATDQRLICLQQERFGRKQVEVRAGQVIGVQHGARVRGYLIVLETPQRRYRIRIPKEAAFRFMGALAPLMPSGGPGAPGVWTARLSGVAGGALSRLVSGGAAPDPGYATAAELARVEATVERLEREVERLEQQVGFLEALLQRRAEGALSLPGGTDEP